MGIVYMLPITRQRIITDSNNGSNNKKSEKNHRLRTDSSISHRVLKCTLWHQIFALESAVVEVQEMFSSHGRLLTNAMDHHGETL